MRLGGMKLPVETFSATSLAKAVACPESWRRRYLCKERDGFGVERFVGTVDHETMACFFKDKMAGIEWKPETLAYAYDMIWNKELDKEEYPVFNDQSPTKLMERGRLMVETYREQVAHLVDPVAVEERFEIAIPGVPVPLIGYIDVETTEKIIERKTSKTKLAKPKPVWAFQGRLYQLQSPKPVEWHVITKQVTPQVVTGRDVPGLAMQVHSSDQTVTLIQQTVEILNGLYQRYGADQPWPTLGTFHDWLCSYCQHGPSMKSDCVAWAK